MHSRAKSVTRRPRLVWIALALTTLLVFLWISGGLLKLNHMAVQQAMDEGQDAVADSRLKYSGWLSTSSGETSFLQARLARHRGEFADMSRLLQAAKRGGFDRQKIEREQALAMAQIGQLDSKLESDLNDWILEGVDTREICSAYANGLAASSRFEDAIGVLAAWAGDFPRDPRPLFRHGRILEHQRRKEEALAKYQAASQVSPGFTPAAFSVARLLLDQRKVDEALAAFESCANAATSIPIQTSIAICKKSQAKLDEAKSILEKVLQNSEEVITEAYAELEEPTERLIAAVELGKLESDAGQFAAAKKWLEQAIKYNPRDMEARYAYAVTLRGLGEKEMAEQEFNYVKRTREALAGVNVYWDRVDANPRDTEARLALAKIFLEHESKRNGLYWLKSITQYEPDNAEVAAILREYAPSDANSLSNP